MSPSGSVMAINSNQSTIVGDSVTLQCTARGGPVNTFSWLRPQENRTIVDDDSELLIANLTAQDGGEYVCVVTNSAGVGMDSVTVNGM